MNNFDATELKQIWNMVFNLSLNFLHDSNAAEEAAQEIFLRAQSSIKTFRHESKFSTWIYKIAYNYLIDQTRLQFRDEISFEVFERDVNNFEPFVNEINLSNIEMEMYTEQIKIGCTKAMLKCLSPIDRFVYIIGKIFGFSSKDGSIICGLSDAAYRKRLSRAAQKIANFVNMNCGLVNQNATCQCNKRIRIALDRQRINPDMLLHHTTSNKIKDYLKEMNAIDSVAIIFRDNPYIDKTALFTSEMHQKIINLVNESI